MYYADNFIHGTIIGKLGGHLMGDATYGLSIARSISGQYWERKKEQLDIIVLVAMLQSPHFHRC